MELKIYNQAGILRLNASTSSSSTLNQELMTEDAISASFTHFAYMALDVNDYVMLNGVKYSIKKEYKPKQKNKQTYEYSVKFYAPIHDAEQVMYLHLADGQYEPQFSLNETPRAHLQKWVDNMNRIYGKVMWSIGEVSGTARQNIEYNNSTCWDALTAMSDTFEMEWWVDGWKINLIRCERGERVTLGYLQGLTSLTQSENSDDVKFFTRLIPLGSTRNIDKSRYGFSRLQLPDRAKYIDKNTAKYGLYEYVESAAFAEIFPQYTGTVSTVRSEEKTDSEGKKFRVYYFNDEGMMFDPNKSEIAELVKRISFQTGDLAGQGNYENGNYWFDANYNSTKLEWEIINIYPADDKQIPDGNLIPRPTDKYIPWNFCMPKQYEVQAELDYEAAVNSFLQKYSEDINKYGGETDYIYIDKNKILLQVGQRVRLLSNEYFPATGYFDTRITKAVRKLDNLSMATIECTEQVGKGWKRKVDESLSKLQYIVGAGSSSGGSGGSGGSSVEASDTLKKDILVNSNDVGYIKKGDVVLAGQTWEKILRDMLYKPLGADLKSSLSTPLDVEYGTKKGYITYTATRNGQGAMKEAYFDDNKENKLTFSAENSGIQTAVRMLSGIYIARETYKATVVYAAGGGLTEKTLTDTIIVNVRRRWFVGAVNVLPTTSAHVKALKHSGLYTGPGDYAFDATDWKTIAICFPDGTAISKISIKGYLADIVPGDGSLKVSQPIMVEGANGSEAIKYNVWYLQSAIVNNVTNNGTITISS